MQINFKTANKAPMCFVLPSTYETECTKAAHNDRGDRSIVNRAPVNPLKPTSLAIKTAWLHSHMVSFAW